MACVFVGLSSFLMLAQLIGALMEWGTVEMQKALEPMLTTLQERGAAELTMGELLTVLRWVGLGSVVLLVAGMVFAFYAARGDKLSRVGATVVAVLLGLLVLPFGLIGVLQAVLLLFAAAVLWGADARRWYGAARESAGAEAPRATAADPAEVTAPPRTTDRPAAVLAAGLFTVLGSSLAGGLSVLYVVVYSFAREAYVKAMQNGPFADWYSAAELEDAMTVAFWACLAMLPLAAAGLVAGLSLLARVPAGRVATLALAWITAAAGVVFIPIGLLGTGAAIAVIVLLNRDESRAWTAGAR
jgi:hypothetical protein